MKYTHDLVCIGLGPAGMAISAMGSAMGLKVAAIERATVGGECMNCGCIPSKSLLRMAKTRHSVTKFDVMELALPSTCPPGTMPIVKDPFKRIQSYLDYTRDTKNAKMFKKCDMFQGSGSFVDAHTVEVNGEKVSAKKIFIATGTKPMVPPIPGIKDIDDVLTNENVFKLETIPKSMVIIGGGAIGCEMAQAFSRLGCAVSMVQMDPYLIPIGDADSGALLEDIFRTKENITVRNGRTITAVRRIAMGEREGVEVATSKGEVLRGERLLVAAGRKIDTSSLKLENAGVKVDRRGAILVDNYLRTSKRHIYACGDVNGNALLSHAAMHQGMLGLMNAMSPPGFRFNFKNYPVPWTVFTDPQVSYVGQTRKQLDEAGIKYDVVEQRYEDYGAAIAEDVGVGYVKAYVSRWTGHIYGAQIVGEGSGEMINEWAMAIQNDIPLRKILMQQHAFPTMGFLTKRIGEQWMMNLMQDNAWLRSLAKRFYRWIA